MHTLFVTRKYPWPESSGSRRRLSAQVACLAEMGDITMAVEVDEPSNVVADRAGRIRVSATSPGDWPDSWRLWLDWLRLPSTPMECLPIRAPLLRDEVARLVATQTFDLIWIYRLETWAQLQGVLPPEIPVVVDADDDTRTLSARRARSGGRRPALRALRRLYLSEQARRHRLQWRTATRAVVVTVANPDDASPIDNTFWVRNAVRGHDVGHPRPERPLRTVGFLGSMTYEPNREGAVRLADSLATALRKAVPGTVVRAIGETPPDLATRLSHAGVDVRGFVEDLGEALRDLDAIVIPVVSGSGTRVKAIDAMAARVPIVSTAFGVNGLGLEDGVTVRLAETDEEFAQAWTWLTREPQEARSMAEAAFSLFEREYSLPALMRDMRTVLSAAGVHPP